MLATSISLQLLGSCLAIGLVDNFLEFGHVAESARGNVDPDVLSLLQRRGVMVQVGEEEISSRSLLSKRLPARRIALHSFSDGHLADDEHLIMNHLAKCGGSFVKDILAESVPRTLLRVENEADSITANDLERKSFIIGLVRNPFDYYVSLWAYTSKPSTCCFKEAITQKQRQEMLSRETRMGSTAADRQRFKKWLFAINSGQLGTESLRFYGSYLYNWGQSHRLLPPRWHYLSAQSQDILAHAAEVNDVLASFAISSPGRRPVDCWIRTEDLVAGLRDCLSAFEAEVGSQVVDWASLNRSLSAEDRNPSRHVPCEMFYDNESLALIRSADKHIIRAFGYPDGCK